MGVDLLSLTCQNQTRGTIIAEMSVIGEYKIDILAKANIEYT